MSTTDGQLTIGEVARRAGLRASAIRYYESIGLLAQPSRVSGQRRYDETVLRRLAIIDVAQRAGLSLDEARTLLDGFSPTTPPGARWRALARRKLPEIEGLIARATTMKQVLERGAECQCISFEDCDLGEFADLEPTKRAGEV
jgi:MerR family redox-sensitive transcriptional activator SoxR